ncbi:unnamed protein product, partial [Iphiclides podalirius]
MALQASILNIYLDKTQKGISTKGANNSTMGICFSFDCGDFDLCCNPCCMALSACCLVPRLHHPDIRTHHHLEATLDTPHNSLPTLTLSHSPCTDKQVHLLLGWVANFRAAHAVVAAYRACAATVVASPLGQLCTTTWFKHLRNKPLKL